MTVQFGGFDREDSVLLDEIIGRARSRMLFVDYLTMRMDLSAVHAHIPLNLRKLASFDDANFFHDVGGINRHMDRSTGELGGCFVPRCAEREGS